MPLPTDILSKAATQARGLAIDAVHACSSGHLGLPLGCAEIGAVLFGHALNINPDEPKWLNRDRFVLSAGHGSMFLYSWLHLAGFELPMEQVKNFRQLNSATPGHPESFMTPGVECTTGPLGQGVGNSVGLALSGKMLAAQFNTDKHTIVDNHIVCLLGDGCMQEGVAREACAFAGHFGLDNLILIYDANEVTLDDMAKETQSEDPVKLYQAMGWDAVQIDGHDMNAFLKAFEKAKADDNGRPKIIVAKTEIGRGIPQVAGTQNAHGEGGAKFADEARKGLGLPDTHFFVSEDVRVYFAEHKKALIQKYQDWQKTYTAWRDANKDKADLLDSMAATARPTAEELLKAIPEFDPSKKLATRAAGGEVLQPLSDRLPYLITGSADLFGSTKNYIKGKGDYKPSNPLGRNFKFGIREHAMGAIVNGFGYDGFYLASGATFLTFSDYMRGSLRLAALSHLPIFHIFTHDSVGVGEDGPTHQPVEITSSLRMIPNVDVIRPADPEETAAAFASACARPDGPTFLILSRQNLPNLKEISVEARRQGTLKGGYIAIKETGKLEKIIIATGSELQHAVAAAKELGNGVRVVSMPSTERFDRQPAEYRNEVLPLDCRKRVAIEAGVGGLWYKYVGLDGKVLSINQFGISAPGDQVMEKLGMTAAAVVEAVKSL
ncbi:MAG: transketolase [Verrucomicrobiota bacterium JB022]|nr:transketolase [Verrucomicrobiota bacterium JB022]